MTDELIAAYTDSLTYEAGAPLTLFASGPVGTVNVELVALAGQTVDNDVDAEPIPWVASGEYSIDEQVSCIGSFLVGSLTATGGSGELSLGAHIWMPRPDFDSDQTVGSIDDGSTELRLVVRDSRLVAELAVDGRVTAATTSTRVVDPHRWFFAAASLSADSGLSVYLWSEESKTLDSVTVAAGGNPPEAATVQFGASKTEAVEAVGGAVRGRGENFFNGKIQSPFVAATTLTSEIVDELVMLDEVVASPTLAFVGAWDLAAYAGQPAHSVRSLIGSLDATLVNLPSSGVTGRLWTGKEMSFVHDPVQWSAVHFHQEDLVDVGWRPLLQAPLPADLPSAVYGLRVSGANAVDTVPIVVVPGPGQPRRPVTVVLPTFTYLAYANEQLYEGLDHAAVSDKPLVLDDVDRLRQGRLEFGISMYDHHADSSGVMYSSASRPILNMRYDNRMWLSGSPRHFSAEMLLIEWLTKFDIQFDVITDLELHRCGVESLAGTKVVITGSHPEYHTAETLDAIGGFTADGGRLMYLGANGFYWVTGVVSESPLVVEIRRGHAGIRTWESYPGETVLTSTREQGGLWRYRGRTPNLIGGVGMAAQGWGSSEPYWRTEASRSGQFDWVFDGVDEEPIGDYGRVMGGAAGDELDRADYSLGTPTDAVVLASSRNHTKYYQRVVEEVAMNFPGYGGGDQDPEVHADMVCFTTPGGGKVFSVGSIAWSGSLLENDGRNGVSRITENVLREFMKE